MERITRKQVEGIFEVWLKTTGRRRAENWKDVGAYGLDWGYGGAVVYRLLEGGGHAQPFGDERRQAREMWYTLHFALRVAEERQ